MFFTRSFIIICLHFHPRSNRFLSQLLLSPLDSPSLPVTVASWVFREHIKYPLVSCPSVRGVNALSLDSHMAYSLTVYKSRFRSVLGSWGCPPPLPSHYSARPPDSRHCIPSSLAHFSSLHLSHSETLYISLDYLLSITATRMSATRGQVFVSSL